jgi:Na+/proline symporter
VTTEFQIALGFFVLLAVGRSLLMRGKFTWTLYSQGIEVGDHLSVLTAVLSIFSSLTGAFMVFGLVQIGVEGGLTGYLFGLAYALGLPLLIVMGRILESKISLREGVQGLDAFLEKVYGPKTKTCYFVLSAIVFIGVLAGQLVAIKIYLDYFTGLGSFFVVLVIGVVGTFAYTVRGGLRAVIVNDIIQGTAILALAVLLPTAVYMAAGGSTSNFTLQTRSIGGVYGPAYAIVGSLLLIPSFTVRIDIWQRVRLVHRRQRWLVCVIVAVLMLLFYGAMTSVGVLIHSNWTAFEYLKATESGRYVPVLVDHVFSNRWIEALAIAGILFAVLSSIDSYLNLVAVALAKALIPHDGLSQAEMDRKLLVNARVLAIAVGLTAIVGAALIPDVVDILSASFGLIGVLLPVFLIGALRTDRRADSDGWIPLSLGIAVLVVCWPFLGKTSFLPAIVVSIGFTMGILLWRVKHASGGATFSADRKSTYHE